MEDIHILLFYKFVKIKNPKEFAEKHLEFCQNIGIRGRILVATEGINGSISGSKEQIKSYKNNLERNNLFKDIVFKENIGKEHPFRRMRVIVRDEIVSIKSDVDLNNKGKYLNQKEFLEIYEKDNEDVVILDTRNYYEYKVGHFKNAIHLDIKTFREFPEAIEKIKDKKDKKIVMYCTGGIRCEKASALMKSRGFKDVYQLKDGIINFCKEYPDTVWEGKCFVFDKRLVISTNKKDQNPISNCFVCGNSSDLYRNCRNLKCDKLFIECIGCQEKMSGCCSKQCLKEFKKQCLLKSSMNQGRKIMIEM